MKKIFYLLALYGLLQGCSADGNETLASGGDGQGGSLARFTIASNHLYTVDFRTLRIFNVNVPESPNFVGEISVGFGIETIYATEQFLYLGSQTGMFVYDINDPSAPQFMSEVRHVRSCDPVVSDMNFAYVTLRSGSSCPGDINRLEVYDVQDPTAPQLLTTLPLTRPAGLGLYNNYLIVCDANELRFLDVANPMSPVQVNSILVNCRDIIVRGNQLIVIGDDQVVQYEVDPNDIQSVTHLSTINF